MRNQVNQRNQTHLKEILVQKFMQNNNIEQFPIKLGQSNEDTTDLYKSVIKVQTFIHHRFEKFLNSGNFNQKNLDEFEKNLAIKLDQFMQSEGIAPDVIHSKKGNRNNQKLQKNTSINDGESIFKGE